MKGILDDKMYEWWENGGMIYKYDEIEKIECEKLKELKEINLPIKANTR